MTDFAIPTSYPPLAVSHQVAAGNPIRSGEADEEHWRAILAADRRVRAHALPVLLASQGRSGGAYVTDSATYVTVITSALYLPPATIGLSWDAYVLHATGTATIRVSVTDGTTTTSGTASTSGSSVELLSGVLTAAPITPGAVLWAIVELLSVSGSGDAALSGITIYATPLLTGDL